MNEMISRDGGRMTMDIALALSFGNKAWTMPTDGTIIVVQRFPHKTGSGIHYATDAWVIGLSDQRIFPANRADLPRGAIWLPLELLELPPTALEARIDRLRTVHEEHSREVLRDDLDDVEKGYYLRQYAQAVEELLDCVDAQTGQEMRGTMNTDSLSTTSDTATPMRYASIGAEVGYVLPSGPCKGETRPAKVVRIWDGKLVNLVVFTDGGNDFPTGPGSNGILWVANVSYSDAYRDGDTWHWLSQDTSFIPSTQTQDAFASA